jgi:type II secretion system protein I
LTLFELLIALAIFLASVAALSHLIAAGTRASVQGQLQTRAILRCESKLAEVVAGAEPLESVTDSVFQDDDSWTWTMTVQDGPFPDLHFVGITVSHEGQQALANTSFRLTRYVRDPRLFRAESPAARRNMERPMPESDGSEQPEPQRDAD